MRKRMLSEQEMNLIKELQKASKTVKEVSEMFDIAKEDVWPLVDQLRLNGYEVEITSEVEGERSVFLRKEPISGEAVRLLPITRSAMKILVISDLELGSKFQQGDLLATAYEIGKKEDVDFAVVAGNISAGKPTRKKLGEYFLRTFEEQSQYIIEHYPKASFKTYLINGPADLSFKMEKGQNLGYTVAQSRDELRYCGDNETTFLARKNARIALVHTKDDSTTYTKSHPLQGVAENFQEAVDYSLDKEQEPPNILLLGGTHSSILIPNQYPVSGERNRKNDMIRIAIPSLYSVTSSERARKTRGGSHTLGCIVLTLEFDKKGFLKKVTPDFRDLTAYQKKNDYLGDLEIDISLPEPQQKVLKWLKNGPKRRGEISRGLHRSIGYVDRVIDELDSKGYQIVFDSAEKRFRLERDLKEEFKPISLDKLYIKKAKVAKFSDPHIGHKMSRWDLIKEVYRIAKKERVKKIFCCGDVFEGPGLRHKQLVKGEMEISGADGQRDFALSIWPKSKIPTELILGSSHELEYLENSGHNIVDTFARLARRNLRFIGMDGIWSKGMTEVDGIKFQLIHPSGGIPIGISYRLQLMIEHLVAVAETEGQERVIDVGHLHIAGFMLYKGMAGFYVPCLEEQTQYLSQRGHIPWLGMWIVAIYEDEIGNITRVVPEYIAFEPKKNV